MSHARTYQIVITKLSLPNCHLTKLSLPNCHYLIVIIKLTLAEKEGLQQVSSSPTSLTVVGGDKVNSDHGTFRFNLGPGDNAEFHEIV